PNFVYFRRRYIVCLGIPGKVVEIYEQEGLTMGKVDFGGGVIREICLAYTPEIELGDYTIIHVGFAISKVDEAEAHETLALFAELEAFGNELAENSTGQQ
ncbi:HypC/HybG/HupF family hydrogenase formation chaperone, partial [Chloroflexota bacterium]